MRIICKRGQTYSLDLLLGLTVFLVMFIGFFLFLGYSVKFQKTTLPEEGQLILARVSAEEKAGIRPELEKITFVDRGKINEAELRQLAGEDYESIQELIGAKKNFCIYLENESGSIIPISSYDFYVYGIGSTDAVLGTNDNGDEILCGTAYNTTLPSGGGGVS